MAWADGFLPLRRQPPHRRRHLQACMGRRGGGSGFHWLHPASQSPGNKGKGWATHHPARPHARGSATIPYKPGHLLRPSLHLLRVEPQSHDVEGTMSSCNAQAARVFKIKKRRWSKKMRCPGGASGHRQGLGKKNCLGSTPSSPLPKKMPELFIGEGLQSGKTD